MFFNSIKTTVLIFCLISGCNKMFRYNDVKISVNQVGYLTDKAKHAWVVGEINKNTEWDIIHAESGKIVYSGVIEKEGEFDEACAENVTPYQF